MNTNQTQAQAQTQAHTGTGTGAGPDAGRSGPSEAALLLKAGAVLPTGTTGAGPDAVDLTARSYR
ncbi:hypothetical protein, partial [Streptomyces xanthophaeus]